MLPILTRHLFLVCVVTQAVRETRALSRYSKHRLGEFSSETRLNRKKPLEIGGTQLTGGGTSGAFVT